MNRTELIETLAEQNGLSKAATGKVIESFLDTIRKTVKKGDAVSLIGFGTFKQVSRVARTGKNPSTGLSMKIPAAIVPKFIPGSQFKEVVDPKMAARKKARNSRAKAK